MRVSRFVSLLCAMLCAPLLLQAGETSNCVPRSDKSKELSGTESRPARSAELEKRREHSKKLPGPEREAKRKELKARLEKRLAELRQKSTNGVITAEEKRHLARGEQVLKRFEQEQQQPAPSK